MSREADHMTIWRWFRRPTLPRPLTRYVRVEVLVEVVPTRDETPEATAWTLVSQATKRTPEVKGVTKAVLY